MGHAREALEVIVGQMGDIPQAIDFIQLQGEDDLWGYLEKMALRKASTTGGLGSFCCVSALAAFATGLMFYIEFALASCCFFW